MKICKYLFVCLGLFVLLGSSLSNALTNSKEQQLRDFHALLTELETHYGMAKYKEKVLGVTFAELDQKYTRLIQQARTLEEEAGFTNPVKRQILSMDEFQQLMIGFGAEFQDGHLNIVRNGKEGWTLGIKTAVIDGRLYVTGVNDDFFKPSDVDGILQIGDEIIEINGRPVEDMARENLLYAQTATFEGRWQWALERTMNVPYSFLRRKNDGEQVRVTFRHSDGSGQHRNYLGYFNWANIKKFSDLLNSNPRYVKPTKKTPYFFGMMGTTESYFRQGLENLNIPDGAILDLNVIINKNIMNELKTLKTEEKTINRKDKEKTSEIDEASILKPISRLQIYSVMWGGLRVGVIRVPSYSPDTAEEVFSEIAYLKRAIPTFNSHTDMLLIDQVSNSGGYVDYVKLLIKLFASDGAIPSVTADIRLTENYVRTMENGAGDQAPDGRIDGALARDLSLPNFTDSTITRLMADRLDQKLKAGDEWTGPLPYMSTIDSVNEGQTGSIIAAGDITYKKKVVILNDTRSASGGDFMPAIMKGSRALIVGSTSMGLGGPVYNSIPSMTSAQMFIRCPYAYCERVDGTPFENVGVVPDVKRPIMPDDLSGGFERFAQDILNIAVLYQNGEKPADIEAKIYADQRNRGEWSKEGREILERVMDVQDAEKSAYVEKIIAAYNNLTEKIMLVGAQVPEEEWPRINIPISQTLLNKDYILSSVSSRDGVFDRLIQMKNLKSFQADPMLIHLIDAVSTTLKVVPRHTTMVTPCSLLLEDLPARSSPKAS